MARMLRVSRASGGRSCYLNLDLTVGVEFDSVAASGTELWRVFTSNNALDLLVSREDADRLMQAMGYLDGLQIQTGTATDAPSSYPTLSPSPSSSAAPVPGITPLTAPFLDSTFKDGFVPFREDPRMLPAGAVVPDVATTSSGPLHRIAQSIHESPPEEVPSKIQGRYEDVVRQFGAWAEVAVADSFTYDARAAVVERERFLDMFGKVAEMCVKEDAHVGRLIADRALVDFARVDDEELDVLVEWIAGEQD